MPRAALSTTAQDGPEDVRRASGGLDDLGARDLAAAPGDGGVEVALQEAAGALVAGDHLGEDADLLGQVLHRGRLQPAVGEAEADDLVPGGVDLRDQRTLEVVEVVLL